VHSLRPAQTLIFLPEELEKSEGSAQTLRMKITVQKTGGIWHGYLEGHPEVDERALTEEIARVKVERIVEKLEREGGVSGVS
jgi:hypothetical protein